MGEIILYTLSILIYFSGCYSSVTSQATATERLHEHRGTVRTYKNQYGDIFHCVDIYQQPALDQPLLINHTIQLKASRYPKNMRCLQNHSKGQKEWNISYHCPKGTIPVKRSYKHDVANVVPEIEYVQVGTRRIDQSHIFGAGAFLDVWNPDVEHIGEYSLAQVMLVSGHGTTQQNSIAAGWIVNERFGHYYRPPTTFFVRWTRDGHRETGCYNLECPGFVHVNHQVEIGGALPVGDLFAILIIKDSNTGDWWLYKDCVEVGYWPSRLFTYMAHSAERAIFGGEIGNTRPFARHTSTQMGSGRFGHEGVEGAATMRSVQVVHHLGDEEFTNLRNPEKFVKKPLCYDLLAVYNPDQQNDVFRLFYGGPGYSRSHCQT